MSKPRIPQPGDLIKIDFDLQAGHEQAGWRPALVVSEAAYNARSNLALICPVTSQAKGYPFEVPLPEGGAKHVGAVSKEVLETVRAYIGLLINSK